MNKLLIALLISCSLGTTQAHTQSSTLSDASLVAGFGSVLVVGGSLSAVAASGAAVITAVEAVGESVVIVLEGASGMAQASIRLSGDAAHHASLTTGRGIMVIARSTGYVLIASGEVIAFIPNEAGKALVHHSRSGR